MVKNKWEGRRWHRAGELHERQKKKGLYRRPPNQCRCQPALEASHADEPAERRVWTANGEAVVVLAAFQSQVGRLSHMFI